MVRSWLDSMIFKVFSNLSDSMILKVMPPVLLCWPTMPEADVSV